MIEIFWLRAVLFSLYLVHCVHTQSPTKSSFVRPTRQPQERISSVVQPKSEEGAWEALENVRSVITHPAFVACMSGLLLLILLATVLGAYYCCYIPLRRHAKGKSRADEESGRWSPTRWSFYQQRSHYENIAPLSIPTKYTSQAQQPL
jgi:hypothetical protein